MSNKKEVKIVGGDFPAPTMESALLEIVTRKDIDPERLEKFLNLQIMIEERQAKKDLNAALASFQSECPIIKQTKKGHNNTYSPLDEIIYVIKPLLTKNGLSYTFNTKRVNESYTELITTIKHSSGAEFSSSYEFMTLDEGGRMNASQQTKSALTYARRAGIEAALGIATAGADDDASRAINDPATDSQISTIKDYSKKTDTTEAALLKHLKVTNFEDLSKYEADRAIVALKQKRAVLVERQKNV